MTRVCLSVDGGGTKTTVTVVDESGTKLAEQIDSGSNVALLGPKAAVDKVTDLIGQCLTRIKSREVAAAWIGLAGIGDNSSALYAECARGFEDYFAGINARCRVYVTTDAELMSSGMASCNADVAVGMVCGTGSVAMLFTGATQPSLTRAGGWGHVLGGDEGSGYYIGLYIIRQLLARYDREQISQALGSPAEDIYTIPVFKAVINELQIDSALTVQPGLHLHLLRAISNDPATSKRRVANLCESVLKCAYPDPGSTPDPLALEAVNSALAKLAQLSAEIVAGLGSRTRGLILTGSLFRHPEFLSQAQEMFLNQGYVSVSYVQHAGLAAAQYLAGQLETKKT